MATISTELLTAADYASTLDTGRPTELVRGVIMMTPLPYLLHGQICMNVGHILKLYVDKHQLGRVVSNDAAIITERDPDTVRGADIAFYSFDRVPEGKLKYDYLPKPPNVVFEVLSKEDRWGNVTKKVGEYLDIGVDAVCVLDPKSEQLHLYHADQPPSILAGDDELTLPAPLDGFRVAVSRFFE